MRKLLALVALLGMAGGGWADDEAIVKRLRAEGVLVAPISGSGLGVFLEAKNFDTALAELCELRGLQDLVLRHPELTDNQLRRVCALKITQLFGTLIAGGPFGSGKEPGSTTHGPRT